MEESKKSPHSQAKGSVECNKCHRQVSPENGQQKNAGFMCNECLAKSKRHKWIAICAILVCCIVAAITWFVVASSDKRSAAGFDGVSEINDSVSVEVDSVNVEFNLATATLTSAPVSMRTPINNIDEFKRVVAQNIDAAKSDKTNSLGIPVAAVQFGFRSSTLNAAANDLIREFVSLYNQTSKINPIVVEGYACNIGEDAPNGYISQQRAEAVKTALVENGVDAAKIQTHWYGKSKNAEFNLPRNEDNRRVLISIK